MDFCCKIIGTLCFLWHARFFHAQWQKIHQRLSIQYIWFWFSATLNLFDAIKYPTTSKYSVQYPNIWDIQQSVGYENNAREKLWHPQFGLPGKTMQYPKRRWLYDTCIYIYIHAISKDSKLIIPYSLPNEIAKAYSLSWVVFLPMTHSMSPLGLVVRGVPAWALKQRKLRIRNNQPKAVSMACFKGTSGRNPWFFISSNVGGWSCDFFLEYLESCFGNYHPNNRGLGRVSGADPQPQFSTSTINFSPSRNNNSATCFGFVHS